VKLVKPLLLLFLSSLLLSACNTAPEAAATGDSKARADHSTTPTRQVQIASADEKPVDQPDFSVDIESTAIARQA